MQKILPGIVCVLVLLFVFSVSAPAAAIGNPFTDVKTGSWYTSYVLDLTDRGILNGKTATTFDPEGKITREEFAKILAVASGEDTGAYKEANTFADVPSSRWSSQYVNWAAANGVVNGVGAGKYDPKNPISRQEMAVMVMRYVVNVRGETLPEYFTAVDFRDQGRVASWAEDAVDMMQRSGVIDGYSNRTFIPKGNATRAEAAKIIAVFLWIVEDGYVPPEPQYKELTVDDDTASENPQYTTFSQTINGVAVDGVYLDPATFNTNVALADHNDISLRASLATFVAENGAKIAINGGFFNPSTAPGENNPYFTLIRSGEVMYIRNEGPVFTVDVNGVPAIGNLRILLKIEAENANGTWQTSYINIGPKDESLEIFTSRWGESLGYAPAFAIAVNSENEIVEIARNSDLAIPAEGFVLTCSEEVLSACTVGDHLTWTPQYTDANGGEIRAALGAGPTVVKDGAAYYDPKGEGFPTLATGSVQRSCIGICEDGMVVLIVAKASLTELSEIMLSLGCVDAMNLDGGSSSGLYVNGAYLLRPGRQINNVLYFK